MKKAILLFALILSAMNIMAQAYEFEITEQEYTDTKETFYLCSQNNFVEIGGDSPDIRMEAYDDKSDDGGCVARLWFNKTGYTGSNTVASLRRLANEVKNNNGKGLKKHIKVYLSDGDVLYGEAGGYIYLGTIQELLMNRDVKFGHIICGINLISITSKYHAEQKQTFSNQRIICQQLRTYDIVKIEIGNESFDVRGLRSAATFDAMFNALAAKTGKGHLYRYNSSSSSSSSRVSSGPSATCELGFVAVYSWGGIGCRVDDFRIVGAKGKDVEVNAIFEDVTDEYVSYGFVKKLTSIPYDDCSYDESFSVRGKVEELARLKRYNRAKFKVYIEVDVGNRCIYTSNAKYVTIYRDGDSWRCTRHD